MKSSIARSKSVALIFRGFELSVEEVEALVGVSATRCGTRGEPVRAGVKTLLIRSYVGYTHEFEDDCPLDDMVRSLLNKLGGVDHLCRVRAAVQPEFLEMDFKLPVKRSDEVQDGFLSPSVIASVFALQATVSFGFF